MKDEEKNKSQLINEIREMQRRLLEIEEKNSEIMEAYQLTKAIFEKAPIGIWRMGLNGKVLDVNEEGCNSLGYSKEELCNKNVLDFAPGFGIQDWMDGISKLNEDGSRTAEVFHQRKNGDVFPVQVIEKLLAFGEEEYHIAFVQDISERRKREKEIREKDILLHDVETQAKIGGWKVDLETGKIINTDEISKIYDLEIKEEVVKVETGLKYYTEDSRRKIEKAFNEAVKNGTPYDLKLEIISSKGKRKWIRTTGYSSIEQGKIVSVQGSFQDITDINQAEESLILARSIIDKANIGIYVISLDGRIKEVNRKAADLLGYTKEDLEALTIADIDSDPGPSWTINMDELTQKGMNIIEREHRKKDGTHIPVEIHGYLLSHQNKQFVIAFVQDISERRKLEEQLTQSRKMEAIGQLAGGVAHDFNNMLAGIMAAAELAQQSISIKDTSTGEYLDMIVEASERASKLIVQLLAFSRKKYITKEEIDIHKLIKETISILSRTIDKRIRIHQDFSAETAMVLGDFSSIHNVLLNLTINASHAMKEGGDLSILTSNTRLNDGYCRKSVFPIQPGNYIEIEIRDTGTGIAPEIVDRIFEPFFTTKEIGEGSGLGLSVVYGTIKNHNGAITVNSIKGEGTSFYVFLPCIQ